MSRWSEWVLIAEGKFFRSRGDFRVQFPIQHGPCCYQLGVKTLTGMKTIYVGKSGDEYSRIYSYAHDGSHLGKCVNKYIHRFGGKLYYRHQRFDSVEEAVAMERNLLSRKNYECNKQLNRY